MSYIKANEAIMPFPTKTIQNVTLISDIENIGTFSPSKITKTQIWLLHTGPKLSFYLMTISKVYTHVNGAIIIKIYWNQLK